MIVEKQVGGNRSGIASPTHLGRLYLPEKRVKRGNSLALYGKIIFNYAICAGVVIASSIVLYDMNTRPMRVARQENLDRHARPATVALITKHCPICNEP